MPTQMNIIELWDTGKKSEILGLIGAGLFFVFWLAHQAYEEGVSGSLLAGLGFLGIFVLLHIFKFKNKLSRINWWQSVLILLSIICGPFLVVFLVLKLMGSV